LNRAFNERHILAISQAICLYRKQQRIDGPLFLGIDTHALSVPALASALEVLAAKYDAVNIKLDKAGGLTEALAMVGEVERRGLDIMVGCMVATSLSMAPAMLVAQRARVVDLDGPLLLAKDRDCGLRYDGSLVYPPGAALWG